MAKEEEKDPTQSGEKGEGKRKTIRLSKSVQSLVSQLSGSLSSTAQEEPPLLRSQTPRKTAAVKKKDTASYGKSSSAESLEPQRKPRSAKRPVKSSTLQEMTLEERLEHYKLRYQEDFTLIGEFSLP